MRAVEKRIQNDESHFQRQNEQIMPPRQSSLNYAKKKQLFSRSQTIIIHYYVWYVYHTMYSAGWRVKQKDMAALRAITYLHLLVGD